jgi:hypothetical protein
VRAGWTGEHRRDVFEQLESAVERSAGNHLEGDIGIPVVDAVAAGAPGDHGEDDHAETVHQACLEERPAQDQAAECAQLIKSSPAYTSEGGYSKSSDETFSQVGSLNSRAAPNIG